MGIWTRFRNLFEWNKTRRVEMLLKSMNQALILDRTLRSVSFNSLMQISWAFEIPCEINQVTVYWFHYEQERLLLYGVKKKRKKKKERPTKFPEARKLEWEQTTVNFRQMSAIFSGNLVALHENIYFWHFYFLYLHVFFFFFWSGNVFNRRFTKWKTCFICLGNLWFTFWIFCYTT